MSSSEVLTTAVVACLFFGGNFRKSSSFISLYCSYVLDESRFHRRLKRLNENLESIFEILVTVLHSIPLGFVEEYAIDSFPVKICENIRANRCKLASSSEFRGYIASKRTYFHGIKLHIVASNKGYIREFLITPGSVHDIQGLYERKAGIDHSCQLAREHREGFGLDLGFKQIDLFPLPVPLNLCGDNSLMSQLGLDDGGIGGLHDAGSDFAARDFSFPFEFRHGCFPLPFGPPLGL